MAAPDAAFDGSPTSVAPRDVVGCAVRQELATTASSTSRVSGANRDDERATISASEAITNSDARDVLCRRRATAAGQIRVLVDVQAEVLNELHLHDARERVSEAVADGKGRIGVDPWRSD